MPKADHLPTDPRFPAFRAHVEAEYGGPLPDDGFLAAEQDPSQPYHTAPCKAFRLFVAGWEAALSSEAPPVSPSEASASALPPDEQSIPQHRATERPEG